MRLMKTAMVAEPELQNPFTKTSVINPKELNYYGNSQGGIMGTVYCALSQDVTAGVIGVGGGPFGILVGACLLCRVSYRNQVLYVQNAIEILRSHWPTRTT